MALKKKKISDFPLLTQSLRGFFTIGYKETAAGDETTAESYKADLGFVEEAARGADTAAQGATAAAERADASAESADSAAGQALSAAEQAASAARSATQTAANAAAEATQTAAEAAASATQTAEEAAAKATQVAEEAAVSALQSAADAAANADRKAAYAQAQGDYAHEQAATIDAKIGGKVDLSSVGQPQGVASLDADGHVPLAQLGALAAAVPPAESIGGEDRLLIARDGGDHPLLSVSAAQLNDSVPYVGENLINTSSDYYEPGHYAYSDGQKYASETYIRSAGKYPVSGASVLSFSTDSALPLAVGALCFDEHGAYLGCNGEIATGEPARLMPDTRQIAVNIRRLDNAPLETTEIDRSRIKLETGSKATPFLPKSSEIARKSDCAAIPYVGENLIRFNELTLTGGDPGALLRLSDSGFTLFGSANNNAILDFGPVIPRNGTYTLRFKAKVNAVSWANHVLSYGNRPLAPGFTVNMEQFNEIVIPVEITDYAADKTLQLGGLSGQTYSFTHVKLEAGTKATPWSLNMADVARAVDHTSLTEQVVPGEFWLDADGIKNRQVYVRTFTGNVPQDKTSMKLLPGVYRAMMLTGYITSTLNEHEPPYIISGAGNSTQSYSYYYCYGVSPSHELVVHDIGSQYKGGAYSFTFLYTKA